DHEAYLEVFDFASDLIRVQRGGIEEAIAREHQLGEVVGEVQPRRHDVGWVKGLNAARGHRSIDGNGVRVGLLWIELDMRGRDHWQALCRYGTNFEDFECVLQFLKGDQRLRGKAGGDIERQGGGEENARASDRDDAALVAEHLEDGSHHRVDGVYFRDV